jgi:two-component system chemotaxis response regulator CheB
MSGARPRILICEDSRTYAAALARVVGHGEELEIAGIATTAEDAMEALPRVKADLVTMDLELPGISGLAAVEEIMSKHPVPILVLSSHIGPQSERAAAALAAGALDALAKDELDLRDPENASSAALRRRLALLSGARVIRHPRASLNGRPASAATARAIGICASTGGPHALAAVLGALPETFPIPILVVQHMSTGFTDGLVRWLDRAVAVPVSVAPNGELAGSGAWLPPEGALLTLDASRRFALDRRKHGLHRPSADVLLQSLAEHVGKGAVSVVLTGMGRDGAAGSRAVREAGGFTIAQDEASSAVFGMPRAAAEEGVDLVLPLDQISHQLSSLVALEAVR